MRHTTIKQLVLLLGLLLPVAWCKASSIRVSDGHSDVTVKESTVQSIPKGFTIHASICGHTLSVVFSENLGQVQVEITTASGETVQSTWVNTPNGLQTYIPNTGDYIVTFTLSNGDVYAGEFTVTD